MLTITFLKNNISLSNKTAYAVEFH